MKRVLDTSVLIDVLRGDERAIEFLSGLESVPICSTITVIEVIRGLRPSEQHAAGRLLSGIECAPVDDQVAARAGALGRDWRESHPGIDTADLTIAATAELSGASLATSNTKTSRCSPTSSRPIDGGSRG